MPGPTDVQQARRDNGPVTDRGATRKRELLEAARRVFERKGFMDARVSDIVKEAHVSHGTFYTYFDTKEAVFSALAHDVIESMLRSMTTTAPKASLDQRIHDSVVRFVQAYRPHAKMIGLIEQVGTSSPQMRNLRLELRDTFVRRTRRGIQRMRSSGQLADPELDIEYTAEVLGAMIEYSCYVWFCLDKNFDEPRLIEALVSVWRNALRAGV